jgi:serine/threonine protein kinase
LKGTPVNKGSTGQQLSTKAKINGGTRCYMAPELFTRKAKFSRKSDVFAAGIVFLELITLQKPNTLYDDLWPGILNVKLPFALLKLLQITLDVDPDNRNHFADLLALLRSTEGNAIKEMELGMQGSDLEFDEVEADLRLLMPSSHYVYSRYESSTTSTRSGS